MAGLIALIAFLTHIKSIEQLMAEGGAIAQNGPAPQEIEVELRASRVVLVPSKVELEYE